MSLINFISESPIGIYIEGNYNISGDMFCDSYNHYKETGYNPLIEHSILTSISWSSEDKYMRDSWLSESNREVLSNCIKDKTFWCYSNFFDSKDIMENILLRSDNLLKNHKSYKSRRLRANSIIAKKDIREAVFNRDNNKCKLCGSTSSLSVDHIKPVIAGGGNELSNLQTLCSRCNSSKGGRYNDLESN